MSPMTILGGFDSVNNAPIFRYFTDGSKGKVTFMGHEGFLEEIDLGITELADGWNLIALTIPHMGTLGTTNY